MKEETNPSNPKNPWGKEQDTLWGEKKRTRACAYKRFCRYLDKVEANVYNSNIQGTLWILIVLILKQ